MEKTLGDEKTVVVKKMLRDKKMLAVKKTPTKTSPNERSKYSKLVWNRRLVHMQERINSPPSYNIPRVNQVVNS